MNTERHTSALRVAIYGCGQLAQMMVTETRKGSGNHDIEFCFIAEPDESTQCVDGMGDIIVREDGMDVSALFQALGQPDVVTVEREHVDISLLNAFTKHCEVHPNPRAVDITKNRAREKQALQALGIPIAPFIVVDDIAKLHDAVSELGADVFIKSCEEGYDGKNQWRVKQLAELDQHLAEIKAADTQLVVEKAIRFHKEVSIIGVRDRRGNVVAYPLAENRHNESILFVSTAPCGDVDTAFHTKAKSYLRRVLDEYDYVGALAIELFVTDNEIYVNELAPRVHNSGHWTMSGASTSQFDNHIRAITGQPLGSTEAAHPTAMVNLIGVDDVSELANDDAIETFLYGKSLRPKRKMGHVNIKASDPSTLNQSVQQTLTRLYDEEKCRTIFSP